MRPLRHIGSAHPDSDPQRHTSICTHRSMHTYIHAHTFMDLPASSHLPTCSQAPTCSDPQCFTLTCAHHTKVCTRGVSSTRRHAHTHSYLLRDRPNVSDHMHMVRGTHIFQTVVMGVCVQRELVHTRPWTARVPHLQSAHRGTYMYTNPPA